jgi:ParB-like chromosome segregation protein Spo0J
MTARILKIKNRSPASLTPYSRNARRHPKKQIKQLATSIDKFGFNAPILVTPGGEVIAGHARLEAAKLLGLATVPTVCIDHLTDQERRAYVIADNKIALASSWDQELLGLEFQDLLDLGFDLGTTGFETCEIAWCLAP